MFSVKYAHWRFFEDGMSSGLLVGRNSFTNRTKCLAPRHFLSVNGFIGQLMSTSYWFHFCWMNAFGDNTRWGTNPTPIPPHPHLQARQRKSSSYCTRSKLVFFGIIWISLVVWWNTHVFFYKSSRSHRSERNSLDSYHETSTYSVQMI